MAGVLIAIAIVFFGSATVHEDARVEYAVKGRVLDKGTGKPVEGAEVLLFLSEPPSADSPEAAKLFEKNKLNWKYGTEPGERTGITDKAGYYRVEGGRAYFVKYRSLFGIKRKFSPFDSAWVVIRAEGYAPGKFRLETKDLKKAVPTGGPYNEMGTVYLEKSGS